MEVLQEAVGWRMAVVDLSQHSSPEELGGDEDIFLMAAVLRQGGEMFLRVLENAVRYFGGVSLGLGTSKEDGLRRWTNSTK